MTVLKGFAPVPDPLDMVTFKQLTDTTAHARFVDKVRDLPDAQLAKIQKLLTIKKMDDETERIIDKSEAHAISMGRAGWETDPPAPQASPSDEDGPFYDPWTD